MKQVWEQPILTILNRASTEHKVLSGCKYQTEGTDWKGRNSGCWAAEWSTCEVGCMSAMSI